VPIDWLALPVHGIRFCIARLVVKDGFQDSVEVPIAAVVVEVMDPVALLEARTSNHLTNCYRACILEAAVRKS
jgi:hypothetical protein